MLIYYLLFIWSIISALGDLIIKDGAYKKIYVLINIVPMTVILGVRSIYTGADTLNYVNMFYSMGENISLSFDEAEMEYGYALINKIIYCLFGDAQFLLIFSAIVSMGMFGWYVYKESENVYLSIILFNSIGFYTTNVNLIRQCMAAAILCVAVHFLTEGKRIKYILLVLIAGSIHLIAYLFMPLLLIYPLNTKKILIAVSTCIVIGMVLSTNGLMAFVGVMPEKYLAYIGSVHDVEARSVGAMVRGVSYIYLAGVGLYIGLKKYGLSYNRRQKYMWVSLLVLISGVILIVQQNISIVGRLGYNYGIFICLLIPMIYGRLNKYLKALSIPFIIILLSVQFINMIDGLPLDRVYKFM